jgi:hypothetical protein
MPTPKPTPEFRAAGSIHQDADPLQVEETIKIQTQMNYNDHFIYRVLGITFLAAFLLIPYYSAKHWLDQGAAKFSSKPPF